MKSPDQDLQPFNPKPPGNISGARELVGLYPNKSDHGPAVRTIVGPDDLSDRYFLYRIIQDFDAYFEIVAKNLAAIQIFSEAAETGKCIAGQDTAKMADYIALVIVFGRLNQDNRKALAFDSLCGHLLSHDTKYSHTHTYPETPNVTVSIIHEGNLRVRSVLLMLMFKIAHPGGCSQCIRMVCWPNPG